MGNELEGFPSGPPVIMQHSRVEGIPSTLSNDQSAQGPESALLKMGVIGLDYVYANPPRRR